MSTNIPIASPAELPTLVQALYRDGLRRGDSTGWRGIDEFYTVTPKQWTLVTGIPGSGKSEWLDALLVNLARTGEWTFALYSPENFPIQMHFAKLAEKFIGKPFGRGPTERMDEDDLDRAIAWVNEFFMWLAPSYKDYNSLLDAAVRFRCANKKFGVVLDPWNSLEHLRPVKWSETEYIAAALTDITKWVRDFDLHAWIVCHPAKLQRGADGKRPVPTPYDIAGSAHWYNKADNIITVHRDQIGGAQDVEIHVQKIRFKHVGRVGVVPLKYNRVTGCYHEPLPATYTNRED